MKLESGLDSSPMQLSAMQKDIFELTQIACDILPSGQGLGHGSRLCPQIRVFAWGNRLFNRSSSPWRC